MSMYPTLATKDDLADYLMVDATSITSDMERMIKRAQEMVYQRIQFNYDSSNENDVEAAKLATCSQVEAWITVDETLSIVEGIKNIKVGKFSVDFGDASGSAKHLSPRSKDYLLAAGLLYAGTRQVPTFTDGSCDTSN